MKEVEKLFSVLGNQYLCLIMAHRGGGNVRGGFRNRGRSSPYWKDKPRQFPHQGSQQTLEGEGTVTSTPSRESNHSHPPPEQSPVDPNKGNKKFSNKSRLFIANLPRDMTESELRALFEAHGEVQEVFLQKEKSFGFCRMAYKGEAERAIAVLNGSFVKGRELKVRFAASSSSVKVDNIHPLVSNELLVSAFSKFGEVESAVVVTDDRGKSKGYGIVDFARKQNALNAIQQCKNAPYLLTKTPIPVVVSELERDNEDEGQSDKSLPKNSAYNMEYELPPRFSSPNDVEFMMASRWKTVFEDEKNQRAELEERLRENRVEVRKQMANIKEQHKIERMRQELVHHQQEQLRLMQQLNEREGMYSPHSSRPPPVGLLPPGGPHTLPLFPPDMTELHSEGNGVNFSSGLLPITGGSFLPPPLMGQPAMQFEKQNFH